MHNMSAEKRDDLGIIRGLVLLGFSTVMCLSLSPGFTLAHAADGHPARIHEGSCESLGPVAFSLAGVGASVDPNGASIATPQPVNPDKAYQVMASESVIDTTIADLLASDHAVMVYDDDEDMQAIACGNLGGAMMGDTLAVGLGELGIPGHVGFALLQSDAEKTDVTILIGHALAPISASADMVGMANMGQESDYQHESEDQNHVDMATPES